MRNASKFTAIAFAVSMALAPVAANANGVGVSLGDGVFNWPTNWPAKSATQVERSEYGSTATLKAIKPAKDTKKQKKKQ
ncbi:MAG: hypothetical protein AAGA53_14035 [Pseudomonadota bacterium]